MTLTPHPYAEKLIAIAEGKQMQYRSKFGRLTDTSSDLALYCLHHDPDGLFIKPETITINGHELPGPMRVAPENGTKYWLVNLTNPLAPDAYRWHSDKTDYRWLDAGLCQETKQGAIDCAKALLSLLEQKS